MSWVHVKWTAYFCDMSFWTACLSTAWNLPFPSLLPRKCYKNFLCFLSHIFFFFSYSQKITAYWTDWAGILIEASLVRALLLRPNAGSELPLFFRVRKRHFSCIFTSMCRWIRIPVSWNFKGILRKQRKRILKISTNYEWRQIRQLPDRARSLRRASYAPCFTRCWGFWPES